MKKHGKSYIKKYGKKYCRGIPNKTLFIKYNIPITTPLLFQGVRAGNKGYLEVTHYEPKYCYQQGGCP